MLEKIITESGTFLKISDSKAGFSPRGQAGIKTEKDFETTSIDVSCYGIETVEVPFFFPILGIESYSIKSLKEIIQGQDSNGFIELSNISTAETSVTSKKELSSSISAITGNRTSVISENENTTESLYVANERLDNFLRFGGSNRNFIDWKSFFAIVVTSGMMFEDGVIFNGRVDLSDVLSRDLGHDHTDLKICGWNHFHNVNKINHKHKNTENHRHANDNTFHSHSAQAPTHFHAGKVNNHYHDKNFREINIANSALLENIDVTIGARGLIIKNNQNENFTLSIKLYIGAWA